MSGKRIHLSVVDSTNLHTIGLLSQSDTEEWTVVSCDFQTQGRGQRGRTWESEAGANLTFSLLAKPQIPISKQYEISAAVSLALVDLLDGYGLRSMIKWPNDLIVAERKIAGMLIENVLKHQLVEWSVIGIGLNVNQALFPETRWPATSVKVEVGRKSNLNTDLMLDMLVQLIRKNVSLVMANKGAQFVDRLNEYLYGRDELRSFTTTDGSSFSGFIRRVTPSGTLIIEDGGVTKEFSNGELRFKQTS